MRQRQWGRIICCTSISAVQPINTLILSNSIRAGLHAVAKTLANTLATEGITVNCVLPGPILSDRTRELAQTRIDQEGVSFDEAVAGLTNLTAMKRLGRVEEFGPAVAFLASEHASFITGSFLRVDGGAYAGLV